MTTFLQQQDSTSTTAFESSMTTLPIWSPSDQAREFRPRAGLSRRALARACTYIETHLGDNLTLTDFARATGVSRSHFARLFRLSTGLPPMAFRLRSRIAQAKQLLDRGDMPICDIAATLGFCDQSHFSRTFRRMVGLTPREFARLQADLDQGSFGCWQSTDMRRSAARA